MAVEAAAGEGRWHRLGRAKIHHVEAAGGDHCGDTMPRGGVEAGRTGGENAADEFVGPFGGRDVEDPCHRAACDQRFHRPTTGACGMEDDDIAAGRFEQRPGLLHAGGRVAEHRSDDEGLCAAPLPCRSQTDVGVDERTDNGGRPGELGPREGVEPRDVGHRRDHHDVGDVEIGGDVAAGERRHHHLRHPERQRSHGRGADRRPPRSPHRHDPRELSFRMEAANDRRGGPGHRRHHLPPVAAGSQRPLIDARFRRHGLTRDIRPDLRRAKAAAVDEERLVAEVADPIREEIMFDPLGVERAEDDDRGHRGGSDVGEGSIVRGWATAGPRSGGPRR